jgi:hypothetical protein
MQQPHLTRHAKQRLQQRGARPKDIEIVMTYGDIEVPARDGCRFLRLSYRAVARLLQSSCIPVQELDRAKRLLVLADASDRVVTVLKSEPERRMPGLSQRRGRR